MDGGERVAFIKVEPLFSYGRTARFMCAVVAGLCLLIGLEALVFGMFGMAGIGRCHNHAHRSWLSDSVESSDANRSH